MKYLFTAILQDGTTFTQDQNDVSTHTPDKNAFYDVIQRLKEVRAFGLINTETQDEYMVDFADGHFEVNGIPMFLHNEVIMEPKLIFFKRNTISPATGEAYPVGYNFGFEAKTLNGQKIERLMTIY